MKEKIAVALAVLLIGMSVSACTRNVGTDEDGNVSSTASDRLPGDNDDGLKDNSSIFTDDESDVESDENRVSSFISSTVSEMK